MTYIISYTKTKRFTDKVTKNLTEIDLENLLNVEKEFGPNAFTRGKSKLSDRTINFTIPTMIQHNITNIVENLKKISSVRQNSFDHYCLIYGEVKASELYQIRNNKSIQTKENFIIRYGEDDGVKKYNQMINLKKKQNTKQGFNERYGSEGERKYKEFINKCKKSHQIDGYIEKYGLEKGQQIFEQLYKVPRLCLERMIQKYGDEGILKYAEIRQRIGNSFKGAVASKESLMVFLPIIDVIKHHNFTIFIGFENLREYFLWNIDDKEFYQYDFVIKELNLIFEFNGEHVHPRKEILSEDEFNNWTCAWTGRSGNEAYSYDQRKKKTAEKNGFDVIYLWRGDGVKENIDYALSIIQKKINGNHN